MSEPTIYKPSIYKGAGIYKTGAGGGGGGGGDSEFIIIDNVYYGVITLKVKDTGDGRERIFKVINKNLALDIPGKTQFVTGEEYRGGYYFPQAKADIDTYCENNGLEGWHVPTVAEADAIFATKYTGEAYGVGVSKYRYALMSESKTWSELTSPRNVPNENTRGFLGFNAEPFGALYSGSSWHGDIEACFWGVPNAASGNAYLFLLYSDSGSGNVYSTSFSFPENYVAFQIRLIKEI